MAGRVATMAVLAAAIGCLLPAVRAPAATLDVPVAYASIQEAINSARSGDTIRVAAGTYREKLYLINRANLTITGAGRLQSLVRNRYQESDDVPAVYVNNSTGIRIEGLGFEGGCSGIVITGNSSVTVRSSSIVGFYRLGVFVGEFGCAPLAPASIEVPQCFLNDRQRYVDGSRLELYDTLVADSGTWGIRGTGLVFFPGTTGYLEGAEVRGNQLTGLFAWGAQVDISGSVFTRNVEHALEYRQYPSPKCGTGYTLRAGGVLTGNTLQGCRPLPGGALGGGMVIQGADMVLSGNLIRGNRAWGISAARGSVLTLYGNKISGNRKAGIVLQKRSRLVLQGGDTISGNRFEGLLAQGGCYVEVHDTTVRDNGRFGVLLQKRSEGRLYGVTVSGNGTQDGYYGGVAYAGRSWGAVESSAVGGHLNGPGIHFYGGPQELSVQGSQFSGNRRSGIVFEGTEARGAVTGNTFPAGNTPYDVACPGGGWPSLEGQEAGAIDTGCPAP